MVLQVWSILVSGKEKDHLKMLVTFLLMQTGEERLPVKTEAKRLLSTSDFSMSVVNSSPVLFSGGLGVCTAFNLTFLTKLCVEALLTIPHLPCQSHLLGHFGEHCWPRAFCAELFSSWTLPAFPAASGRSFAGAGHCFPLLDCMRFLSACRGANSRARGCDQKEAAACEVAPQDLILGSAAYGEEPMPALFLRNCSLWEARKNHALEKCCCGLEQL